MNEVEISPAIEQGFTSAHDSAEKFNLEFDLWRRMAAMVMADLSYEAGWKGKSRSMDFSDFSGYYMEYSKESVQVLQNGTIIGSVFPEGNGIRTEGFEDIIWYDKEYRVPEDLMIISGKLCCSEENIALAKTEMHQGHEVLDAFEYRGMTLIAVDNPDDELKSQLASMVNNVKFVTSESLFGTMNSLRMEKLNEGPEPLFPKWVYYYYDGASVFHEKNKDVIDGRPLAVLEADRAIFKSLEEKIASIRRDLDKAAGISEPGDRPFLYKNAIFPSSYLRNESVSLLAYYGQSIFAHLEIRNGMVNIHNEFPFPGRKADHVMSVEEAVSAVKKKVLSKKNISIARKEYMVYCMNRQQDRANSIKIK